LTARPNRHIFLALAFYAFRQVTPSGPSARRSRERTSSSRLKRLAAAPDDSDNLNKGDPTVSINITENAFEYGTQKYFRGNAHLVELGTFGEKKDPIGAKAYVDPYDRVKADYLTDRVIKGKPVAVDWTQTSKAAVEVNGPVSVFGMQAEAAVAFTYEKIKSANLKLFNLSVDEHPLITMLNKDANAARNFLAEEGNDGRIISEVWVVMEAQLSEQFDTSGSVKVAAKGVDISVTASGGKYGSQTITLSKGSIFAYKLHKVKDWNKGKTQIENMEADYKGMN
jgi:hypothetical protein